MNEVKRGKREITTVHVKQEHWTTPIKPHTSETERTNKKKGATQEELRGCRQ